MAKKTKPPKEKRQKREKQKKPPKAGGGFLLALLTLLLILVGLFDLGTGIYIGMFWRQPAAEQYEAALLGIQAPAPEPEEYVPVGNGTYLYYSPFPPLEPSPATVQEWTTYNPDQIEPMLQRLDYATPWPAIEYPQAPERIIPTEPITQQLTQPTPMVTAPAQTVQVQQPTVVQQPVIAQPPAQVQQPAAANAGQTAHNTTGGNAENFNTYDNPELQNTKDRYVLNLSSKKFHYPSCESVRRMKIDNYATTNKTRDEVIRDGYSPCGQCNP